MVNIVFLLERPSQFDAPLFRIAERDPANRFTAWFTAVDAAKPVRDPEIDRTIDWGGDRLEGYHSVVVPSNAGRDWFKTRLVQDGVDLLVVNGYTRRIYLRAARSSRSVGVTAALRIDTARFPGDPPISRSRRLLVGRLLPLRFHRFLATGSLAENFLRACGVAERRIGRFPYAVDTLEFSRRSQEAVAQRERIRGWLGASGQAKLVLSLTKFSSREAPWDLLDARERLPRADIHWVLAGDGPLRAEVEARIRERALDRVVLPGYVPYPELPRLYSAADLFVHPVREERWGVSVAEALSCGLPVVTSDRVGAGYDLIERGENGDVYPSGSGAALAVSIERALTLSRERVTASSRGILKSFGLEATWSGLVTIAEQASAN